MQPFAHQPEADCQYRTRSLRIAGHGTSIRLETASWAMLENVAGREGVSLPKVLTRFHDELMAQHGEVRSFASLLRCSCLIHLARGGGRAFAVPMRPTLMGAAE